MIKLHKFSGGCNGKKNLSLMSEFTDSQIRFHPLCSTHTQRSARAQKTSVENSCLSALMLCFDLVPKRPQTNLRVGHDDGPSPRARRRTATFIFFCQSIGHVVHGDDPEQM